MNVKLLLNDIFIGIGDVFFSCSCFLQQCSIVFCIVAVLQDSSDPGVVDLYYTMHCLSSEDIKGLPPGGGLPAK